MWLMLLQHTGECSIIDPSRNVVFRADFPELAEVEILSSKAGWLLALRVANRSLFFHPATRSQIKLPPTRQTRQFLYPLVYSAAAFSSSPSASDCVTVILNCLINRSQIFTWRPGDDQWIVHLFDEPFNFKGGHNLFACGELFYCQGDGNDLKVLVFNARETTCRVAEVIADFNYEDFDVYLTEFEEDLHAVFVGGCGWPTHVVKVDSSLVVKEKILDLDDRTIFIGRSSFGQWMVSMVRSAEGQVTNKIYFPITLPRSDRFLYHFSVEKKRYYPNLHFDIREKLKKLLGLGLYLWRHKFGRVWIEADKGMWENLRS